MSRLTVTYTDGARLTAVQSVAPEFSPEAQAMLDVYSTLGVALVGNELNQMVSYVDSMVASGNYLLVDAEFIFSLAGVNALIDWKGSKVATNNGATFDVFGATFAGAEWIDSNYNPAIDGVNYLQNSANAGSYIKSLNNTGTFFGNNTGNGRLLIDGSGNWRINNASIANVGALLSGSVYTIERTGSNNASFYKDAVQVGVNQPQSSSPPNNENIFIGALNSAGAASFFDGTLSTFIVSAAIGFNQPQYNTDLRALLTGLGTI